MKLYTVCWCFQF